MTDLELGDFRMAFATALADWFREHAIVCEHTQVIHFGDAAGAVLNTPEFTHLRALTATCTCGATYATYEGPEPDCAVHGAVSAFHAEQDAHAKTKRDVIAALEAVRHRVVEDCWYTCPAATEERDGGECCNDDLTGDPCDCGRDARIAAMCDLLGMTEAA